MGMSHKKMSVGPKSSKGLDLSFLRKQPRIKPIKEHEVNERIGIRSHASPGHEDFLKIDKRGLVK